MEAYSRVMSTHVSNIQVRRPHFEVDPGPAGVWNPKLPEHSHTLNAFQLALPYLEPYFIDAVKQAIPRIQDPKMKADAYAFCAQEANHAREHKHYCRVLEKRYPRLKEFETAIQQSLIRSRKRDSLEWRLAYTAGYEVLTMQLAKWTFRCRDKFFEGVDPQLSGLLLWHAAEEIEHRHVAYDVLREVTKNYFMRFTGLMAAALKTVMDAEPVVNYLLTVDGFIDQPESRKRRRALRKEILQEFVPAMARYLMPGHHPSQEREPEGYAEWMREHAYDTTTRGLA